MLITQLFTSTSENFHPKFNVKKENLRDRIDACANWIASLFIEYYSRHVCFVAIFFFFIVASKEPISIRIILRF